MCVILHFSHSKFPKDFRFFSGKVLHRKSAIYYTHKYISDALINAYGCSRWKLHWNHHRSIEWCEHQKNFFEEKEKKLTSSSSFTHHSFIQLKNPFMHNHLSRSHFIFFWWFTMKNKRKFVCVCKLGDGDGEHLTVMAVLVDNNDK